MTATDDTASRPWIWHGMDVYAITETLATKWATSSRSAAVWLSTRPGMDRAAVVSWVRVMKATLDMAADHDKPTAEEIRECVRMGERRGW